MATGRRIAGRIASNGLPSEWSGKASASWWNGQRIWRLGLLIWLLINLAQAYWTTLDPDEAYYWMYSRDLAWGYFDHPPAVALLVWLGYALFPNELGVRLGAILLQLASFWMLWVLLGKPREGRAVITLLLLLAAMPLLQVYGFVATPDAPLLFFTVLFLWTYRRFLQERHWSTTLALGACMAALLYSKYHGVLVIFFILLSNLSLLRQARFYVASFIGFLLFFPHLYWQYLHDFPSFRYHLQGRDDPYELKHTATYLVNQVLVFSPLLFPLILSTLARRFRSWPAMDTLEVRLERALYFLIGGFWIFFFWMTFKGHAEPHWTAVLSFAFVILLYRRSRKEARFRWWAQRLSFISLGLLLVARLLLVLPVIELRSAFNRQAWAPELEGVAGDYPVVFQNAYREASQYRFLTGKPAYTFTDRQYRPNQYDIWDWEKRLHNRRILFAGHPGWNCEGCQTLEMPRMTKVIKWVDSLQVSQKVRLRPVSWENTVSWRAGSLQELRVTITNPYSHAIRPARGDMPLTFWGLFYDGAEFLDAAPLQPTADLAVIPPASENVYAFRLRVPDDLPPTCLFGMGIRTGRLPAAKSSDFFPLKVSPD